MNKYVLALFATSVLAGCQIQPAMSPYAQPVGYVSATPSNDVEEYVSAWEEAQEEMAEESPQLSSRTGVTRGEMHPSALPTTPELSASDLWGRPVTSSGKGVTLRQESLRRRLNDALDTTPLGGSARWEERNLHFLFMPNSPVYTPHQSGGRCRDGVFAVYGDGFNDKRLRGLFCQTGPGADWLLKMYAEE